MDKTAERNIFCNRTLNLRSIRAIGYDMDYTLIHYRVEEWESVAYNHLKEILLAKGLPIEKLTFNPEMVTRGLIIDTEHGNLVKANRFGFIKHAFHGTAPLGFEKTRELYSRIVVDLSERRWVFLNTLFSLSEGCMYSQMVDLLDQRALPNVLGYEDLYRQVRDATNAAHMEGRLKAEIMADPDRFVVLDDEIPLTLLDQRGAGKKLMLITNSDWHYTAAMMTYAFGRFLPKDMTWRDVFDVVIIGARKPDFFTDDNPFFEVATPDGMLRPNVIELKSKTVYLGGSAKQVEKYLGLSGDDILYVGDHMYGDVHVTKNILRWRTALVLRELEDEIRVMEKFRPKEEKLAELMARKERLEAQLCEVRIQIQRKRGGYSKPVKEQESELQTLNASLRQKIEELDKELGPLAKASTELSNPNWGLLFRAGNDKSHLAFQIERRADVYTSRVSNFLRTTPYAYLRSVRGTMPHDVAPLPDSVE